MCSCTVTPRGWKDMESAGKVLLRLHNHACVVGGMRGRFKSGQQCNCSSESRSPLKSAGAPELLGLFSPCQKAPAHPEERVDGATECITVRSRGREEGRLWTASGTTTERPHARSGRCSAHGTGGSQTSVSRATALEPSAELLRRLFPAAGATLRQGRGDCTVCSASEGAEPPAVLVGA